MDDFFINKKDLEQIFEHAVREHPYECCGVVIGSSKNAGKDKVYRCTNIQNRLHNENPEEYPRDARTAYNIDPYEFLKILKKSREKSCPIKAFYHSHTENKAYFSEEDRKQALLFGEPTYPGAKYIVVSVVGGKLEEVKAFSWDEKKRTFKEERVKS